MTVYYEWRTEHVTADEVEDITDSDGWESLKEAARAVKRGPQEGHFIRLVLTRDDAAGRSWAYLDEAGELSDFFLDAYDRIVCAVPKKFKLEFSKDRP